MFHFFNLSSKPGDKNLIFSKFGYNFPYPRRFPLIVVEGFEFPNNLRGYTSGRVATRMATHVGQDLTNKNTMPCYETSFISPYETNKANKNISQIWYMEHMDLIKTRISNGPHRITKM